MHKSLVKYGYAISFGLILMSANTYALLKTFVLPSAQAAVVTSTANTQTTTKASQTDTSVSTDTDTSSTSSQAVVTDNSYQDDQISIKIDTIQSNDTTVYVADVQVSSAEYLQTALAQDTFGTNITDKTSSMASKVNAILAVNGDYYGANNEGYVIKNGVVYRDIARDSDKDDLIINKDGSFSIINEADTTAEELVAQGAYNSFAFGPSLIESGKITVSETDEVGQSMASNPRTAIGIIDDLHYILVVSDGRTEESAGLSLYQLAQVMADYGVNTAYNLDGGGSSTMYFMGEVVNKPTTHGKIEERAVSDIVYIGY